MPITKSTGVRVRGRVSGIACPYCGSFQGEVKDSRPINESIRRRRLCLKCREKFTTYEILTPRLYAGEVPVVKVRRAIIAIQKASSEMAEALAFLEQFGRLGGGKLWEMETDDEKADGT